MAAIPWRPFNLRGIKMKGLLSLLIFSMVLPAHAGIVIYGTRIIYPAENKEVMVQLMNQGNRSCCCRRGLMMAIRHYHQKKFRFLSC